MKLLQKSENTPTMTKLNKQWLLHSRPLGLPTEKNFSLVEKHMPHVHEGQFLMKTLYLSVDPYIRARMRNVKSYIAPLELNHVIQSGAVGEVIESKNPNYKPGDFVLTDTGWQEYAVSNGEDTVKLDLPRENLSLALGALGMTGFTAYFALLDLGKPKAGETVLISGAAGAVGSIAGQIAKIKGCRVVGIAGSDEKCQWLTDQLGFDVALNYKKEKNIRKAIKEACPNRVDVYFDNVGGEISDAALTNINMKARIIIVGQIAIANRERIEMGPRNLLYLLVYRARMEGFLVRDYESRYPEAFKDLKSWMDSGQLKHREHVVDGFENTPHALIGLFKGENIGKAIVKVAS